MRDLNKFLPPMPPPPFATPEGIVAEALPSIAPHSRIDVPTWAEQDRKVKTPAYTGPWDNNTVPHLIEPMSMATSRRFEAVIFVGPARSIKTEAMILNPIGQRIVCMPRDMLVVCSSQKMAKLFSTSKLDKLVNGSPAITERKGKGRGADNLYEKKFKGGMNLQIAWPVADFFSMVDWPDVFLTDYDRMPDDVDEEGSPFDLGIKRIQSFYSTGMAIAEGSPSRPQLDSDWKPASPHEAPPTTGLLSLFNMGSRGKLYWPCPSCEDWFEPLTEYLKWEDHGDPGKSAESAYMACPHCGGVIDPDQKAGLNRQSKWLHESSSGELVGIDHEDIRGSGIVSYWHEGPAAVLQSWKQIVSRQLQAEDHFKRTGDETKLKTTTNIDQGRCYLPKALLAENAINVELLKKLSENYPLGIAPTGTRFVTVQVDVQPNKFAVSWDAWTEDLERYTIDRLDIVQPPKDAPNGADKRGIDPPRYIEDWEMLKECLDKPIEVVGTGFELLPRAMIVDSGGAPGTTSNAYKFLRTMRTRGYGNRFYLSKGRGGFDQDRAQYREPEKVLGAKRKETTDIRIVFVGTDKLKDEVTMALTRKENGPGKHHLSSNFEDRVFEELCAEQRFDKGWDKIVKAQPNEQLDLAVYGKALVIVLKAETIDWAAPPVWAAPVEKNSFAAPIGKAEELMEKAKRKRTSRPRKRRMKGN
ncbi:terminase gpA endonuclease subunit [Maritalea myrionectae]|uniref:terminase gpA endonuclease subunit n=1 Tax=Maritalea myrionectae TaxID=454601 RepID=UPI0004174B3E|nr:terminase gpA endonuclease subunit [Maritalea myrionectae]